MQGVRRRFGPLLAFKECVDSKGSYDYEKDLAFNEVGDRILAKYI